MSGMRQQGERAGPSSSSSMGGGSEERHVGRGTHLKKGAASKYDLVKVKVWLGASMDHYYILSRFLISRMLTVTMVPVSKANRIALDTKKFLVDNDRVDVTQAEFENTLLSIMQSKGFGEEYISYRMVNKFYQMRQPLVIMIGGAPWTGKSTIAQQLAARLNMPNVMQTEMVYQILKLGDQAPLQPAPLYQRGAQLDSAQLIAEFMRECHIVRKGLDGDFAKTLSDGKPLIIEGMHLDPGQYLPELSSLGVILLPGEQEQEQQEQGPEQQEQGGQLAGREGPGSPQSTAEGSRSGEHSRAAAVEAAVQGVPLGAGAGQAHHGLDSGLSSAALPCTSDAAAPPSYLPPMGLSQLPHIPASASQRCVQLPPSSPAPSARAPDLQTAAAAPGQITPPRDPGHGSTSGPMLIGSSSTGQLDTLSSPFPFPSYSSSRRRSCSVCFRRFSPSTDVEGEGGAGPDTAPGLAQRRRPRPRLDVAMRSMPLLSSLDPGGGGGGNLEPLPSSLNAWELPEQQPVPSGACCSAEGSTGAAAAATEGAVALPVTPCDPLTQQQQQPTTSPRQQQSSGAAGAAEAAPGVKHPHGSEVPGCSACGEPDTSCLQEGAGHSGSGHSPAAAAGTAATAAEAKAPRSGVMESSGPLTPLFIPVILQISAIDHELMAEERLASGLHAGMPSAGRQDASAPVPIPSSTRRPSTTSAASVTASLPGMQEQILSASPPISQSPSKPPSSLSALPHGSKHASGSMLDTQLRAARVLQEYLVSFESQGLPVLEVQYGNFGATVEALHAYVLRCIEAAMEWTNEEGRMSME